MTLSLADIEARINQLAQVIGAPPGILPTYGFSEQSARPHIEGIGGDYAYVVSERGFELSRFAAFEIDEILFKVFADVAFTLAVEYELAHRVEVQDVRRLIFRHQLELLAQLSPAWAEREAQQHAEILRQHPFDDQANLRVEYTKQLRGQGIADQEAWRRACEQYPLPEAPEA